jgi:spermidine/putrescine transport system substrate-binding protein
MEDLNGLSALQAPISRRRLLQGSAVAGAAAFLAACGGGTGGGTPTEEPTPSTGPTAAPTTGPVAIEGPLNFANWPAYIDLTEDETSSPTLEAFKAEYGIEVNYVEDIQANEDFVATITQALDAGLDTGWDLVVLTDYMAARLVRKGWLEEIDPANVPTAAANLRGALRGMDWDTDQKFHYPWQSGADGVGYNRVSTGRDLTSLADLFDPAFAGKVTLLSGYQDSFAMIHLLLRQQGKLTTTPDQMTVADAQKIHDFLKPYVDSGHVRGFTGNEYLQDFGSGDTWVAIVWSGDLASSGGPDDRFVYASEGSIIWTDNMVIPKGAVHKRAAEAMIDWVYDVDRAAALANWIYYISPVAGVEEAILALDPEAGANPLLFPPAQVVEKQFAQPALSDEDDLAVSELASDLEGA